MSWILRIGTSLGVAALALLGSATAHADDASYIAALDAAGVFRSGPPNARLSAGHRFCSQLRNGETPDQIVAAFPRAGPRSAARRWSTTCRVNPRPVIDIAQHELCPETLG